MEDINGQMEQYAGRRQKESDFVLFPSPGSFFFFLRLYVEGVIDFLGEHMFRQASLFFSCVCAGKHTQTHAQCFCVICEHFYIICSPALYWNL